ncbi:MAG: NAD(P)H-quinone oxidoreductase, partial [Marinospirillum sp.]|uniref:NAD(P)H-quinone oxidoreductase n=1 Tax=Marinospirillum sp. TaxID=2183934 RepID=UPI001A02B9AF
MQVIEITQPGGTEVLQAAQRPLPEAFKGQILIKVAAAGINRLDIFQRQGNYPVPPGASDIPGLEVSGEIIGGDLASADNWLDFKIGDQVCALMQGGGYAEYAVAELQQCLPIPAGLTPLEAAALPEALFTVWSNVFDRGRLGQGPKGAKETLLVQGGTSGIGTFAIQLAHALGYRVFATAGTDEKCRACEALGAVRGINYRTEDFVEVVRQETQGEGVDVILDMVAGGDYLARELEAAADDGRIVIISLLGGAKAEINLSHILRRRVSILGGTLRPRGNDFKGPIARHLYKTVWPLLEQQLIKPVIYRTFPLSKVAEAHQLMESSQHIGKILL